MSLNDASNREVQRAADNVGLMLCNYDNLCGAIIRYKALRALYRITRALNIVKIHFVATKMRNQKNDYSSFLKEENYLEVERGGWR